MDNQPIVQTDLWNSLVGIFLLIDSFGIALTFIANPCAYLLWKYLMERIYDNNLQIVADLKENIRREIRCILSGMIV